MKLISWNVNGIRATYKKGFIAKVDEMAPDVLCLQETKAQDDQVREALFGMDYHIFSNSAERKGYSGTAVLSRTEPLNVIYDMGIEEHDKEGRVIAVEYSDFWLVTVYTPNSGQGLVRLEYRKTWDRDFILHLKKLEQSKPVVVCGDLNVAHKPIDLKNPKSNYNKTAGYTQAEIDGMDSLLGAGYVDTFRHFNPDLVKYSWWSWRGDARAKNVGWRIDYFLASHNILPRVAETFIYDHIDSSDHCPVGIVLGG